ncbi:hypothetical protein CAEBREN_22760 [Caenorhabditis brenneri]|uniref:Uncharacterized protein n=1 Tax=Caenorhabditis brenneri TaxID=135651 RepID=G0MFD1_CAEBE|nr:hypothetical protein CAEBREN_22760 [Caenorhabditis brenneri]
MSCINCSKKRQCCFKSCTLDKSNVLKEYITNRLEQNERLQEKLIVIIDPVETLKLQITEKEDQLIKLRSAIQESKQRLIMKNEEVKKLNSIIKPPPVQSKDVFSSQSEYLKSLAEKIEEKKKQLRIAEETLATTRMECFQQVFRIFPIKIHIVTESNSFEDWVIVNDTEQQKEQITIRNSRTSKNPFTSFKEELTAFSHTFQLVKILIMIFNFFPPKRLPSLRDLCIGDREMPKYSLWISLCDTIIHLCAHIGMTNDKLETSHPYRNLIEMATFLGSDPANFMKF